VLAHHGRTVGFGGPFDAIVPVPSRRRVLFDSSPAEEIARRISDLTGAPVRRALVVRKKLRKQTSLSRTERAINVRGAFGARPRLSSKLRSVLVVDDVWTTGATAGECAAALRQAGVGRVSAFALARGGSGS
jgi:predicted amidophosphoribosyltransferase